MEIEQVRYDDPAVRPLVAAVQAEYVQLYGGPDADPTSPQEFAPPSGLFLLGRLDGAAAGMGGFRLVEPGVVEIKRMYVADAVRGRGLSRRMLAALEAAAKEFGARRVVLCTGYAQGPAMALYESSGYRYVPPFGHYAATEGAYFYGKSLSDEDDLNEHGPSVSDGPLRREVVSE